MSRAPTGAGVAAALLLLLLCPRPGLTQEREDSRPLTKSELVRLLVDSSLGQAEIAKVVRRVCLTFEPGEDDLADLERAGAGPEVLAGVRECARSRAPVRIAWASSRQVGRAGETVLVEARATRGSTRVEGLRLVVEEGGEVVASARTDAEGHVGFRLPAGTSAGSRLLRLRARDVPTSGAPELTLDVRPGSPAEASLRASAGGSGPAKVSGRVEDGFGNPVPGTVVHLVAGAPSSGDDGLRLEGETRAGGQVTYRIPEDRLPRRGRLLLVHGRDTLAAVRPSSRLARGSGTGGSAERGADGEDAPPAADVSDASDEVDPPGEAGGDRSKPPRSAEEAVATGRRDLERERPLDAVRWFRRAVELRPTDGDAWSGLGEAWLAAGEPALAREALRTGRREAEDSASVAETVEALGGLPPWGRIRVFGGGGWQGAGSEGFGTVELLARVGPGFAFRAGYESTLLSRFQALVRGSSDVASVAGGVSASYGPDHRVTTSLSAARLDYGGGARELVYRLGNELRLSSGGRPLRVRIAGTLGRWWDRDDWLVSTEVEVPVAADVSVIPAVHVGETSGTDVAGEGRRPAAERRGEVSVVVQPRDGWIVAPTVAYARVNPLSPPETGGDGGNLLEGRLRLTLPLGPSAAILVRGRHQRPPFTDAFTDAAVGFSYSFR